MKKKQLLIVGFSIFFVLISIGLSIWVFYSVTGYEIVVNKKKFQMEDDYQFQTQYGNLTSTLDYFLTKNMNISYYEIPDYYAWGESYIQDALVTYFGTTKNQTILSHLLYRMENVISNSDQNSDGIPGYGSSLYEGYYVEYLVWDAKILRPIAELANIVKSDSSLKSNLTLSTLMDNYIEICENVILKWNKTHWREIEDYGYFVSPPDNISAIFNRNSAMGNLLYEVYRYTQNTTYLAQLTKISRFFMNNLIKRTYWSDGAFRKMFLWGYQVDSNPSDVSHACIDVKFALNCYNLNIIFQQEDMEKFANTFFDVVFQGDFSDVIYSDYIDGKDTAQSFYLSLRSGWLKLFQFYRSPVLANYIIHKGTESIITQSNYNLIITFEILTYLNSIGF